MDLKVTDKKRLFLVVGLLVLLIIVTLASTPLKPKSPQKEVNKETPSGKVPDLFNEVNQPSLSYVGGQESFPKEVETFTLDDAPLSKNDALTTASLFGFTGVPLVSEDKVEGEVLFWNSPTQTLRIRLKQKSVKFALKSVGGRKGEVLSFEEAKKAAQTFLESKNLFQGLSFSDKFEYLVGLESSASVSEPSQAEAIKVTLNYTVSGYPLIDEYLGVDPVALTILNDGRVAFVSYLIFKSSDLKRSEKVSIRSLEEARQSLAKGEGYALGVLSPDPESAPPIPSSSQLDKIYLAYFHSVKTATVQPIFVFEGSGARALVPAVKTLR